MKKQWCRHIEWSATFWPGVSRHFIYYTKAGDKKVETVPRSWELCPICGKRRPKK